MNPFGWITWALAAVLLGATGVVLYGLLADRGIIAGIGAAVIFVVGLGAFLLMDQVDFSK